MSSLADYLASRYGPAAGSGASGGDFEKKKQKKRRRKKKKSSQQEQRQRMMIHIDDADAIPTADPDHDMALDEEDRPVVVQMEEDEVEQVSKGPEVSEAPIRKAGSKWRPALPGDNDSAQPASSSASARSRRAAALQAESDSDASVPRRRRHDSDSDASPPRRRRHDSSDSDASPPRRRRHDSSDSDASPPRRRRHDSDSDSDASPPRRRRPSASGDLSPPRRQQAQDDLSPPRQPAMETVHRTADGQRMDPKAERLRRRRAEEKLLQQQAKQMEWGRGIAQTEKARQKREEDAYESSKPLARTKDDEDYNKALADRMLAEDPMFEYMQKKKEKEALASGRPVRPVYRGPPPEPNRFGIQPGHRWDGHDRSNGFERKLFASQSSKRAMEEEAYKWSVENM